MRNALLNGFFPVKPVTTAFDEMFGNLNKIVRDPFFDDVENFFQQPVLGYNVEKTDEGYVVEMPVPGFTKKDVTVTTNDRTLVISLEGVSDKKWVNKNERTFTLPKEIDTEAVTAKVVNGVLTVTLPICTKTEKTVTVE
jgi:HSP20 family protein